MNKKDRDLLPIIAQNVVLTKRPTTTQQEIILKIWDLFQDGQWHKSVEIANLVERSPSYIQSHFMPGLKTAWGLVSGHLGYMLPTEKTIHKCQ